MKKYFFDQDGCLAEYRITASVEKMKEKEYFETLKPEWNVLLAFEELYKKHPNDVYILTKVYPNMFKYSIGEKIRWVKKYLPNFDISHLLIVDGEKYEKTEFIELILNQKINKDFILVDDYTLNLNDWEKNNGTPIKYQNGINDTNKTFKGKRVKYDLRPEQLVQELENI